MEDKLMFVSIVGTQALGTLEPLLLLKSREGKLPVRLLYTSKTRGVAERLQEYIREHDQGEAVLIEVPISLDHDNSAPKVGRALAEEAGEEGRRICFNTDGGLNFMIVATALALEPYKPLYIQATKERGVLTDSITGTHYAIRLKDSLLPQEILHIQDVDYEANLKKNPDESDYPLAKVLKDAGIALQMNCISNVRIDNQVFDYVWNTGNNRLTLVKDWRFHVPSEKERLHRDRDLAQWSKDRNRSSQMYDKTLYAVVGDKKSQQRLEEDSNGQIRTIFYRRPQKGRPTDTPEAHDQLKEIFRSKPQKVTEGALKIPAGQDLPLLKDDTLVTCLGTDLITTMLAICSHKPKHVLLCYSPENQLVEQYAERICQHAKELGVETVSLAKFRLEGLYAEQVLPQAEPGARIVINISPGTKGQGVMLARWAAANGFEVWSINGRQGVCSPIFVSESVQSVPLEICDPALLFQLLGRELDNAGTTERELASDFAWLDALLAFMRYCDEAGMDADEAFARGYLKAGKNELKKGPDRWHLKVDGRTYRFKREGKGVWFEKLCARALLNAGASHVRLNLALKWNKDNWEDLSRKHGPDKVTPRMELDVLGAFRGKLVLISAKSYDLLKVKPGDERASLSEAVQDARNTSNSLDKFALSIVTHMGSTKQSGNERVALLTWGELCRPDELADLLMKLASRQQTTNVEE